MSDWREVGTTASSQLLALYDADALVTFRFDVAKLARDPDAHYMRYENARMLVADWINDARRRDLPGFSKYEIDVWLSHRSERGVFQPEMELTLASPRSLPADELLRVVTSHPALRGTERGVHPVALGAFPEVRVVDGTIGFKWKLEGAFVDAASAWYRRHHGPSKRVNDRFNLTRRCARLNCSPPAVHVRFRV